MTTNHISDELFNIARRIKAAAKRHEALSAERDALVDALLEIVDTDTNIGGKHQYAAIARAALAKVAP